MDEMKETVVISEETIHDRIYNIRGYKVMLDFELAEIYGYTTTKFNQQVKNGSSLFRVGNCIISLRNFSAPVHSLPSEIMTS